MVTVENGQTSQALHGAAIRKPVFRQVSQTIAVRFTLAHAF